MQVTPFLGILEEIQELQENVWKSQANKTSETDRGTVPADYMVPKVTFIWVVRYKEELSLLSSRILATAR